VLILGAVAIGVSGPLIILGIGNGLFTRRRAERSRRLGQLNDAVGQALVAGAQVSPSVGQSVADVPPGGVDVRPAVLRARGAVRGGDRAQWIGVEPFERAGEP
jgi:hypothetical protein